MVEALEMVMDHPIYMGLSGVALAVAGLQGLMDPNAWVLASPPVGQFLNLLPDIVHQALGGLFLIGGAGQTWAAVQEYL